MTRLTVVAIALVALTACGTSTDPTTPTRPPSSTPSSIAQTPSLPTARATPPASTPSSTPQAASLPTVPGPDTVAFHLDVSNQSFAIPEVRLVIELDGSVIIDDVFAVEGQHTYVRHEMHVGTGSHEIVVTAPDHDSEFREAFALEDERWALISFWLGEEDPTEAFSWSLADEQFVYA